MFCAFLNAQQPSASASSAVVPRLVNFSGRAADSEGKIITGMAGATFAIYKDENEGSPLWLESQNIHSDAKGNYTVQLGATKPEGLPLDLFTSGEARWLGVSINNGSEQPRILLLSVPYALKAADAETIGGLPPSAFVRANSTSGASVAGGQVPESAGSQGAENPLILRTVKTKGGATNFLPFWKNATTLGNSVLFQSSSGQVGLGTTGPQANFDVFSGTAGIHAPMGRFGSNGATDANSILVYTGALSGTAESEVFVSGGVNEFLPGTVAGDGGLRVAPGAGIAFGDVTTPRLKLDSAGNASQPRTVGGMVKAMLHFSPFNGGRIISCFNSTLSGAAATTPPCGFLFDITGVGDYIFDFGFEVDDRIYSVTPAQQQEAVSACGNVDGNCNNTLTNNQVEVTVFNDVGNDFNDAKIHLIIY